MPDSLILKFETKDQAEGEAIQRHDDQSNPINNKALNEKFGSDRKLRLFIDIFNVLAGDDRNDIQEKILINELIDTGHFTDQEALLYINRPQNSGFIFERRTGLYALI
jgi:hypothetical protein